MTPRLTIVMPTRDRRPTVETCLPAWAAQAAPLGVPILVADDYSATLDRTTLLRWGATAVLTPHPDGPLERGGWSCCRNMARSLTLAANRPPHPTHLYVADSDTYPADGAVERLLGVAGLMRDQHIRIATVYNSSHREKRHPMRHVPRLAGFGWRDHCAGASMLLDADHIRSIDLPALLTKEAWRAAGAWDHIVAAELAPVLVSLESWVDHLGRHGLHNGNWSTDRALNPRPDLAARRPELIKRLEESWQ